jgi:predicted transposase/invertase (TIGR01784 family)
LKRLLELSSVALVQFINGLFNTNYPLDSRVEKTKTETVSDKLRRLLSDTMLIVNGVYAYHLEGQIDNDRNIAIRVFEYGFAEALKTKKLSDNGQKITLKFPNAKIIFWEATKKMPDEVVLTLEFPEGEPYDYKVRTFKFLEHGIRELAERKLAILLPFYVLKLRRSVKSAKNSERRAELAQKMKSIVDELVEAIDRCAEAGLMDESDKRTVVQLTEQLYKELFANYSEFKEADSTLQERILLYSEEAELRGMEKGMEKGIEKKAFDVAKKMLSRGMTLTEVAEIAGLPLESVKTLIN